MARSFRSCAFATALLLLQVACSAPATTSSPGATPTPSPTNAASSTADTSQVTPPPPPESPVAAAASPYDALPEAVRAILDRPFTGDFDEMVKRRLIRAGVVFNRTQYFVDKGEQRGIAYESLRLFEEQVNKRLKTGKLQVHVVFVPLPRDQLLPSLVSGKVDLVTAQFTVTPEREAIVDFSEPLRTGVSEVVVTSPEVAKVASAEALSGRQVFVRRSSSYFDSITRLNRELQQQSKPLVVIKEAAESLEDDDLLEMVNAGLVDTTVMDDFVATFWQQVFSKVQINPATLRTGGTIAVAVRKNNPRIRQAINIWIKEYGPRTTFGNVLNKRYLESTKYAENATSETERKKFETLIGLFRKYGERYDIDYLLMAAQGYQESRLDHGAKSAVGAIGIMQVMPATGKELKVGDITTVEPNVHAGIKYVRWMMDQYFKDDPMDAQNKLLMTLAAYNCGPGRLRQLRQEAAKRGLNPNVWFGNVERIASERIGRETVQYVGNIYKYYVAYRLSLEQAEERRRLKQAEPARQ